MCVAWRLCGFLEAIEELLDTWEEEQFLKALPELRLAFSILTPRETNKVAKCVAKIHGKPLENLTQRELSEQEMMQNLHLNQMVQKSLERDFLQDWISDES